MNVEKAIEMHSSKDAAANRGLGGAASESAATDLVSGESINSAARQCLLKELRYLAKNPHPAMDIFPSESYLAFWKVITKAPKEDSCLYANGTYLLYLEVQKARQPPPDFHVQQCHKCRCAHTAEMRDDVVYWYSIQQPLHLSGYAA